jgi:hypothetical protein
MTIPQQTPVCFYCGDEVAEPEAMLNTNGRVYGPCCRDVGAPDRLPRRVFGFTGSGSRMPSQAQARWLRRQLAERGQRLHHGACINADAMAHALGLALGLPVMVHPPLNDYKQMTLKPHHRVRVLRPKKYLDRNKDIVDACDVLLATPDGPERKRSGTWSTIRYAVRTGVPVEICYPNGKVEKR